MRDDPSHDDYMKRWSAVYEKNNYEQGMAGYFLKKSHEWCERPFGSNRHFSRVIEVGAGTGVHIDFIRHSYDEYILTDLNASMLAGTAKRVRERATGKILVQSENACKLSFDANSFDRLIATHVLEHLPEPHNVIREWHRVLKPGGVLSIVLPCDPGVAWRVGRAVGSREKFIRAGIDYDYWMAREHINAINCLVALIEFYFDRRDEQWLPMRLPSMDLNLFYIVHVTKG